MDYREFLPHAALASNVECLWRLSGESTLADSSVERVFPDGCVELIVHLEETFRWREERRIELASQPVAVVVGQLTRPMWLSPPRRFETWGVRFRPWGAYAAFGVDLHALSDAAIPLDALWGPSTHAMIEALRAAGTLGERRSILEDALLRRLAGSRLPHSLTRHAARTFLRDRGATRVARVAKEIGWTERHLERRFLREIGLSPKAFSRTVRFQYALAMMQSDGRDGWAGIAWDCGFADQAHLIREFRGFAGATPARLRQEALRLAGQFVQPQRLDRYFAG